MSAQCRALEIKELRPINGQKILLAQGEIGPDDGELVRSKLKTAIYDGGVFVLNSDGGSVTAGIEIGRAIWRAQMETMVAPSGRCFSACFLSFLGGRIRMLPSSASLGSHQFYLPDDTRDSAQDAMTLSQNQMSAIMRYAMQTGVDMTAFTEILTTPPTQMRIFSVAEAAHYRISTPKQIAPESGRPVVIFGNGPRQPGCPWPDDFLAYDPTNMNPECR